MKRSSSTHVTDVQWVVKVIITSPTGSLNYLLLVAVRGGSQGLVKAGIYLQR